MLSIRAFALIATTFLWFLSAGLAAPALAGPIVGGSTVVTLDLTSEPNFVAVGGANGIAPAPIAPGSLGGDPLAFAFPITGVTNTNILHSGGISLTQGDTALSLTAFDIDLVSLTLFGTVTLADTLVGVLPLFDIDGSTLALSLTSGAADALNSVFATGLDGAPVFAGGLPVGTARFATVSEPAPLAMFVIALAGMLFARRRVVI